MFIQFIIGQAADRAALKAQYERWVAELAPTAHGWLGSTGGIAEDGTCVMAAMFESAEAAGRNSGKPEQDEWWAQTAKAYASEPTFINGTHCGSFGEGAAPAAGFVQVMRGTSTDPTRVYQMMADTEQQMRDFRPDILGGVYGYTDDGTTVDVIYFASEAQARAGEQKPPPAEATEMMAEMEKLSKVEQFIDLKEPWHLTPR